MFAIDTIDKVADRIIWIHRSLFQESPSHMKLQKLCYYAEGFFLAEHDGQDLFPENFQAWVYGPVCQKLYHRFKEYGWKAIDADNICDSQLPLNISEHLQNIVEAYGHYDGAALSRMTHEEAPWKEARGKLSELAPCEKVIKKQTMRDYFKSIL